MTGHAMPAVADPSGDTALPRSGFVWALYEGGRTPYVILIKVYVFVPYLATVLVGDAVRGQALVAQLTMAYGLLAAITCPLLGAAVDATGPRKPLLAAVTALMVLLIGALWWAKPDGEGLPLAAVCAIIFAVGLLFAFSEVLHNALLPYAVPPRQTAMASGLGLAFGSGFAVVMLVAVLWGAALPAKMSLPFLPAEPLFGLSAAAHETDRIVAPLVATVLALAALPLLLFGRDAPRRPGAVAAPLRGAWRTLKALPGNRPMAAFLISRMLYNDGMTAILLFTGIYAAGVMKWGALQLLALGVIVSVFLAIGGLVATRLDRAFGPRRALQIALTVVIIGQVALLGAAPDRLLFLPASTARLWDSPVFATAPELAFLAIACANAVGICASYASSRSMLTHLSTPETVGGWFGLYALSGSVTAWLAAALVGLATALFHTQQAGFVALIALLASGLFGLTFVRPQQAPAPTTADEVLSEPV